EAIADFLEALHRLSEKQYMEIQHIKQEFLNSNQEIDSISLEELDQRLNNGEILLLDVRPHSEYESNHIPGAVSLPIDEIEDKISNLIVGEEVVGYCVGTYGLMSVMDEE